jgi:hypothetical protein
MKLVDLVPGQPINEKKAVKESLDDLDTTLPQAVDRYLERMVAQIKGMNLNRKKEILVLAKVIDAMGIDKQELMRFIQKIKQNDILKTR